MLDVKKSQYIISYQPVTSQKYCGKHSIKYIIKGEKFKLYLTPASCYIGTRYFHLIRPYRDCGALLYKKNLNETYLKPRHLFSC